VVFATCIGGIGAGLANAAVAFAYTIMHFAPSGELFKIQSSDWIRFGVLAITLPSVVLMVGQLRRKEKETRVTIERKNQELSELATSERQHAEEMEAMALKSHKSLLALEKKNSDLAALEAAIDHVNSGVVLLDQDMRVQFINGSFRRLSKISEEFANSKPTFAALVRHGLGSNIFAAPQQDLENYVKWRAQLVRIADPNPIEIALVTGDIFRFECSLLPNGGRMLTWINVTDLVRHAEEMEQFRLLADNAGDVVVRLSLDGVTLYVSPAVERVLGWTSRELLGTRQADYVDLEHRTEWENAICNVRDRQDSAVLISRLKHKDGRELWVETSLRLARDQVSGTPREIVAVLRDVSERKAVELELEAANERLTELAATDALTGLLNRRSFDDVLNRECRRSERSGRSMALVLLDVDRFKDYNDSYGHQDGDDCLRRIAQVIFKALHRPGDLAARYGGEEFAVILPDTDERGGTHVAERLRTLALELSLPHRGSEFGVVTISLGVASLDANARIDEAALIRAADRALYEAKRTGRNKIVCASAIKAKSKVA
jgi:diguanylate cyclase (GGDEF)-like protein/PAS domain S-box-containing protein